MRHLRATSQSSINFLFVEASTKIPLPVMSLPATKTLTFSEGGKVVTPMQRNDSILMLGFLNSSEILARVLARWIHWIIGQFKINNSCEQTMWDGYPNWASARRSASLSTLNWFVNENCRPLLIEHLGHWASSKTFVLVVEENFGSNNLKFQPIMIAKQFSLLIEFSIDEWNEFPRELCRPL